METKLKYVFLTLGIMLFILSFFPDLMGGVLNYIIVISLFAAVFANLKK